MAADIRSRTARHGRLPSEALRPVRVPRYDRAIRPNWSDEGQHVKNFLHECMDIRARPEWINEADHRFVRSLEKFAIRNGEIWLSELDARRLGHLVDRFTNPHSLLRWQQRQAERAGQTEQATEASADWRTN
jgi:hypothetical protein